MAHPAHQHASPGDHDFYIDTTASGVLAHNAGRDCYDGNNSPRNNQAQNKSFKAAVRAAEQQLGRRLCKAEVQRVHYEITKQEYGYDEIIDGAIVRIRS